jgi:membrane-associated phospholipid phosphatase
MLKKSLLKPITPVDVKKIQKKVEKETVAPSTRRSRSLFIEVLMSTFAVAFAILMLFARSTPYFSFDLQITNAIQRIHNPIFLILMQTISFPGYTPQSFAIVTAIVVALFILKLKWEAFVALLNALTVSGINVAMKSFVHRQRPSSDLVHVLKNLGGFSFPSGHVMFYASFFGFLLFISYVLLKKHNLRRIIIGIFAFLILTIGLSRIYVGDHWASDVLGAYLFGTIWLVITIYFYEWGKTRYFLRSR